ncbi:hypothetical protein CBS101457_004766 [Exobasidium rhododendri]|nr:hypothetical protein CBS101457_004766 [Exobasidium rhododendri]
MRRNPNSGAAPSEGLPPPPPYQAMPSRTPNAQHSSTQQQAQYAPPPGPPPGHSQGNANPYASLPSTYVPPRQPPNLMDADPQAYISSASPSSYTPSAGANAPMRQESVTAHASRLSQQGSTGPGGSSSIGDGVARQPSVKENQLEFLRAYDSIFIVDDSSSMNVNEKPDGSMGQSRWEEARDALAGMVELAARMDDDGVDIHFLNSEKYLLNCRDPRQVKALFDSILPEGLTPTGTKLEMLLLQYMDDIETYKSTRSGKEPKKRNYICLTDGAATDDPESVVIATARRLDRGNFPLAQIGIQFVQVGDDKEAKEALEELDDALSSQHSVRDIVDTVPYQNLALNPDTIIKALLGGINRRQDRKKA